MANIQLCPSNLLQTAVYENVHISVLGDSEAGICDEADASIVLNTICKDTRLELRQNDTHISFVASSNDGKQLLSKAVWKKDELDFSKISPCSIVIQMSCDNPKAVAADDSSERGSYVLRFMRESDARNAHRVLTNAKDSTKSSTGSVFERRTDASSAEQYFQFYSLLSQQQNMLQDYVRTSTYQRAILDNAVDFRDKVVMDVGAGSGILSFFAIQAGAKRVYAVEASGTAQYCETLVNANQLAGRIVVVRGKLEEIQLEEPVDILVSEPLGYMLFNERMLETFLHAKKFLRVDPINNPKSLTRMRTDSGSQSNDSSSHPFAVGRLFPTRSELFIAPFTDDALFTEVQSKANFWYQQSFHGCVDLTALRDAALREYFRQPVVDTFDVRVCCAPPQKHSVDFATADETDLIRIDIPLRFVASQSATIHGIALWFDVAFIGSASTVWLSTSPTEPLTHWYQVRCLVPTPIFVHTGQVITGRLLLSANTRQSYDVDVELATTINLHSNAATNAADALHTIRTRNTLDLKNPLFRYTGLPTQPPPGSHSQQTSPSELYWQAGVAQQGTVAAAGGMQYDAVMNGVPQPAAFQTVAAAPVHPSVGQQQYHAPAGATCDGLLGGSSNGNGSLTYGAVVQQFTA